MDPTTNPTPTPNPEPNPTPAPEPAPAPEAAPVAPAVEPSPTPASAAEPVAPVTPPAPGQTPSMVAGGITSAPVNPIINPSGAAVGGAPKPTDGLSATDPIMKPEPAPEPDPVEEELKAPMKAAAPVPGSIGSAVSGPTNGEAPAEGAAAPVDMAAGNKAAPKPENPLANLFGKREKKTPNVAFNDPAAQADAATGATPGASQKKTNKNTLIALICVAAVIIVVLIIILIMQMNSGTSNNNNNVGGNDNSSVVVDEPEEQETPEEQEATPEMASSGTLSCTRNMTAAELAKLSDAVSGSVMMSAEFDKSGMMTNIALIHSVVYGDEDATKNEPVQETIREDTSDNIDTVSALQYDLPVDENDVIDFSFAGIQANYESLDYVCEAL